MDNLDFNKVLENLSTFCRTYIAKNFALKLKPNTEKIEVQKSLDETEEALNLIYKNSSPAFDELTDITLSIQILENEGTLSAKQILDLAKILRNSENLKNYFIKDFIDERSFPILSYFFNSLYCNKNIADRVFKCILDENTFDDKASPKLNSIRRNQKNLDQNIKQKLTNMIHSNALSKYIQESIVTIRDDRYVILVKSEDRSKVNGFVHDISNGGATVFIEPTVIFEMNNELNSLKVEEELEIEKILKDLSSMFYEFTNELKNDFEIISKLDFIFAKAQYGKSLNAIIPKINDKKEINLINARHPLIEKKQVVPICINLGKDFSVLIITGPNTGGKTVCLKTVGLLELMACSGLSIPVDLGSSIYVFDNIFADIGDNQSILDSLSTFSSHILNIKEITKKSTSNSLILLDELGAGTDPIQGSSLAISILDFFYKKECLIISTTHYQELKQYAFITKRF